MKDAGFVRNTTRYQAHEKELRASSSWGDLIDLYLARADVLQEDPAGQERVLHAAGEVALEQLGDRVRAATFFLRAYQVRRSFLPSLGALKTLYTEDGDLLGLEQVLQFELGNAKEPRRRAQLYHELGVAFREEAPSKALEALSQAVQAYPKSRRPLDEIEALAKQLDRWDPLIESYEALAGGATGSQAAVYQFLAGTVIDERVKDSPRATRAFAAALDLGPGDPRILGTIVKFCEKAEAWELMTRALYQQLDLAQDPVERARILRRNAGVHGERLGQPERAITLLVRAIELCPQDQVTIKQLFKTAQQHGDAKGMALALEHEAELPNLKDAERAVRLEKAAEQRDRAGEGRKALAAIRKSLKLRPRHPRALKILERVTRRLGDWPEHARVLELERGLLDPQRSPQELRATTTILRRLADVVETRLKDPARTARILAELVELEPDPDLDRRLELLARAAHDWAQVAAVLERRLERSENEDELIELLRELGELRSGHLDDPGGAIRALDDLLAMRSTDEPALESLVELRAEVGDPRGVCQALQRLADVQREDEPKAATLRRLAEVQLEELEEIEPALETLDRALGTVGQGEGAREACRLRVRAVRRLDDDARLSEALDAWRRLENDPAQLRKLRIELAGIAERKGDVQGALEALEEIIAEAPADSAALPALSRLLRQEGRLEEAVQRLEAAAVILDDQPAEAAELCAELAVLYQESLRDSARARESWRRALVHQPTPRAFEAYAELARRDKAYQALVDALDEISPRIDDPALQVDVTRAQAELARDHLERPGMAALHLERLLELAPGDPQATRDLLELYRTLERWDDLAALLEQTITAPVEGVDPTQSRRELAQVCRERLDDVPRAVTALEGLLAETRDAEDPAWEEQAEQLRGLQRHRELVELFTQAASIGPGPLRAQRLADAASVCEERLNQPAAAAKLLTEALTMRPGSVLLLERLASVHQGQGAFDEAAQALEEAAKSAAEPETTATLLVRKGGLLQRHLGDDAGAERAYEGAIATCPSHQGAHEALIGLLQQRADWEKLERALERGALAVEGKERAQLLVRRGRMLAAHLGRLDDALETFEAAERAAPGLASIREAKVRALRPAKRSNELAEALAERRRSDAQQLELEERLRLLREEAELRAFSLDDPETARELLLEAHQLDGSHLDTLYALLRVERRLLLVQPLADHLQTTAALEKEPGRRADLLVEAGRVLKTRGSDIPRARMLLERALEADPQRVEAVRWLAAIARDEHDDAALLRWTEREAELEGDPHRRSQLLTRLARLMRRKDPDGARARLEEALEADPSNLLALRSLSPLLRVGEAWTELEQSLARLAELEPDRRLRLERYVALGEVRLYKLAQPEPAGEAFEQALALEPTHMRALRGRVHTLSRETQAAEHVAYLLRILEATAKVDEALEVGRAAAQLQLEKLGDHEAAVATLERVLRAQPRDEEAWRLLRDVYLEGGRWEALADAYEREGRASQSDRVREERLRQTAQIHQHHLGDKQRAVALYGEILDMGDPHCFAIHVLPPLLRELGRERDLEATLLRIPEIVPTSRVAAECLVEVAGRELQRGERAAAVAHLERACVEYPQGIEALDALIKLHEQDLPALVDVLDRKRAVLAGTAEALKLRVQRALLLEQQLHDPVAAAEELQAAERELDGIPGLEGGAAVRRAILTRLARVFRRQERYAELADVLGRRAEAVEDVHAASRLLRERAVVERERLDDPGAAISSLQAALAREASLEVLGPLIELYAAEGRHVELAEALEQQARLQDTPKARAETLRWLARVIDEELEQAPTAIRVWEQVLDLEPGDPAAFAALDELTRRTGDKEAQARVLERELASLRGGELGDRERLATCALEASRLWEELGAHEAAIEVLAGAHEDVPAHAAIFTELERLQREQDDAPGLLRTLSRRALAVEAPDEVVELGVRAAALAEERLGDTDEAVALLQRVLELRPEHEGAARRLKALLRQRGAWTELTAALAREIAAARGAVAEGEGRDALEARLAGLQLELGEALDLRLGRSEEAAAAYTEAHARAPSDPRPLLGLERLLSEAQDWQRLVDVRLALRHLESNPQRRAELAVRVAEAHEQLGQRDEAIASLNEALEEQPDSPTILGRLRSLLIEEQRWERAEQVLAREARVARQRVTQYEARLSRGRILRDRLERPRDAAEELERAHELMPHDPAPLRELVALYDQLAEREPLVASLEALAVLEEDDGEAAALTTRAGQANHEADPARAVQSYERSLRRDPLRAEPLEAVNALYRKLERWAELARGLHRAATLAEALGEDPVEPLRQAAGIEEQRLGAQQQAAATLDRLVELAPEDKPALVELARLRGELGEHAARAQVLGGLADLHTGSERRALLLERATLLAETLERPAAAADCVAAALETLNAKRDRKQARELAGRLIELREASGDGPELLAATERALALADGEADDDALLRQVGALAVERVYTPVRALEVYEELYRRHPEDEQVRTTLSQLLRREGRHAQLDAYLAGELQRLVAAQAPVAERVHLLHARAELLRGPLGDLDGAERCYRDVLALDADDEATRGGLETLLRVHGRHQELAQLLAEKARRAKTPVEVVDALRDEALVQQELGDELAAIDRLEAALRALDESVSVGLKARTLRDLIHLLRGQQRWEDLAQALRLLAEDERLASNERSAARSELGLVLSRQLDRQPEAVAAFEEALTLDAQNVPAARSLADLYRSSGDRPRELSAYEREATAKVDKSRLLWLRNRIGALRHELGDPAGAVASYQASLELDADSLEALRGLSAATRELGDYHQLAQALEATAQITPSPVDRLEARRELAQICEEALNDVSRAVACYRHVLSDAPDDLDAVRGLARGLRSLDDPAALVDCLELELRLVHDDQRSRVLALEAARLRERLAEGLPDDERKAQLERALQLSKQACRLAADDAEALQSYARVTEELGRWQELADVTCRLARSVDDATRAGWMFRRAAKIRSLRLRHPQGAVAAYLEAVKVDPADREAWDALEPLAEEVGDTALTLRALHRRLELADKKHQRAEIALKLGLHLANQHGDLPRAIEAFSLARNEGRGPLRGKALQALEQAYRRHQRWDELAQVLAQRAQAEKGPVARDLLLERAKLLEEQLARPDEAVEVLRALREQSRDELIVARELERLLSFQHRWEELVAFYEDEAAHRGQRGYESLILLGRVWLEHLDDPRRAAHALQRAVRLNPSGLEAVTKLRDLYTRTEEWSHLLDALRLEIGLVEGKTLEARLGQAARLAEDKLGDLASASRYYAEAAALAPADQGLLQALARVQAGRGDYAAQVETLQRELSLAPSDAEQLELHKRIGEIYHQRLFRPLDAVACYRAALALAPQDPPALVALSDLLRDLSQWAELTEILERRLQQVEGAEAVSLRLELAHVQAEKQGQPDAALAAAEQALQTDPRCVEAAELMCEVLRRHRHQGNREAQLATALKRLAALREGTERADALVELAGVLTQARRDDAVIAALQEAFKADPTHEQALERLSARLAANQRWDELLATSRLAAERAPSEFRKGELLARAGEVLEQRHGDLAAAEDAYRESFALAPSHLAAVDGLARVLEADSTRLERERAEELVKLLDRVASLDPDPEHKARAMARAGVVLREVLDQPKEAMRRFKSALGHSPLEFESLASLGELAYAREDYATALKALEQAAASPRLADEPDRGAELLWARGTCLLQARRTEAAAASFQQALEQRPGHLQALEDLARIYLAQQAWPAARAVCQTLVERTHSPVVRAEHQLELARAQRQLRELEAAQASYEEALVTLPQRADAQLALGELLAPNQPAEARQHLEYAIALGEPEVVTQARLVLAELCEVPLQDPDAAAGHLSALVEAPGDHRAQSARRLAEIMGRSERWMDAIHHLKRAIELEPDPTARAELYASLARVLRDRIGQRVLARRCFERAVEHNPLDLRTLESFLRLLEQEGDLQGQAHHLGRAANAVRESGRGDEVALRTRRCEVLLQLGRKEEAAKDYERVRELQPLHAGAQAALSRLYLDLGAVGSLERVQRQMLQQDPLNVKCYRALAEGWRASRREEEHAQALQVLTVMRGANEEERRLAEQSAHEAPRPQRSMRDQDYESALLHPDLQGPMFDLFSEAGALLARQISDDHRSHQIGWRTPRHGLSGDAFPEHGLLERVCELLGIETLDVYWMPDWKKPEPVIGHGKSQSIILCPEVFSGLSEPEKAFVLGRAVGPLRYHLEVLRHLPTDQAKRLVLGLLKGFDSSRSFPGDDEKPVRALVKAVSRSPELLESLAQVQAILWEERDHLDFERLRRAVLLTANRCGLLAAGGMLPATRGVVATNLSLRGRIPETSEAVAREFREIPELCDMAEWSVSEGHLRLRNRLFSIPKTRRS